MKKNREVMMEWDKPMALAEWERDQMKDEPILSTRCIAKWSIFLSSICAVIVRLLLPDEFLFPVLSIVAVGLLAPVMHFFMMRSISQGVEMSYVLRSDGIVFKTSSSQFFCRWKLMRTYKFGTHSTFPDFSVVNLEGKYLDGSKFRSQLVFDSGEVDAAKLKQILDTKLTAPPVVA